MENFTILLEFNYVSIAVRVILAMLLGGCIGLERERNRRPAGLRTHILVCLGSCLTAMIGLYVVEELNYSAEPLRIAAQVISGIGFLGVGTILVRGNDHITGLTTAAGLWSTAAVGIATGYGFYEGALFVTVVMMITTAILFRFEATKKAANKGFHFYLELKGAETFNSFEQWLKELYQVEDIRLTAARSAIGTNVGVEVKLRKIEDKEREKVKDEILKRSETICFVEEER